jgi:outer membrane protein insertion porin family/translocation and assembly module TamA
VRLAALVAALALCLAALPPAAAAQAEPDGRLVVRQLDFVGNEHLTDLVLANSIVTTNSSWFARFAGVRWLGFGEKRYFDERAFQADVYRLRILYRRSGFPDAELDTVVQRTPENVFITVQIEEGRPVLVDSLVVRGTDTLPQAGRERLVLDLPLQAGDVFDRSLMQATADTLTRRLRNNGYPEAEVFTSFTSRQQEYAADVSFDIVPGPRARFGEVRVEGNRRIDSSTVSHLLAAQPGRRFSQADLYDSQRNLYRSELFRFAQVEIDSAAWTRGGDTVPLVARVTENRRFRARTGIGYGTTDCLRGSAGIAWRDFFGQGRVLDLSTRVSKVGVGEPLDWGLRDNVLCRQLEEDSLGSRDLNYNVTASLRRPAFLSPNNTLTLAVFNERRSEFKIFVREETGVSVSLLRETPRRRLPISLTYTLSSGRTEATPATFCAFLQACDTDDIAFFEQRRRLATLTLTGSLPRVNNVVNPTRGSLFTGEITTASRFIGSSREVQFTRASLEASWYRPLSRRTVLSWRLRGGLLFAPQLEVGGQRVAYVPPEQRFYAGGPYDVRGFQRNELGPVVYVVPQSVFDSVGGDYDSLSADPWRDSVRVTPTGGNTLFLANAELRFPSPVLGEQLRLAVFSDLGALWNRDEEGPGGTVNLRLTPGVGLRLDTPLGPARLDFAYNFSRLAPGRLVVVGDDDDLVPQDAPFQPRDREGLTIHFAIGQAF